MSSAKSGFEDRQPSTRLLAPLALTALIALFGIAQLATPTPSAASSNIDKTGCPECDGTQLPPPPPTTTCPEGQETSPSCGGDGASGGGGSGGGGGTAPSEEGCCFTGFPSGGGVPTTGGGGSYGGGGTQSDSGDGSVPADAADPADGSSGSGGSTGGPVVVLPGANPSAPLGFDDDILEELRRIRATANYLLDRDTFLAACRKGFVLDEGEMTPEIEKACWDWWKEEIRSDQRVFVQAWCPNWGFTTEECQRFWDERKLPA